MVVPSVFSEKIEWVRLKECHPSAFEDTKAYEKNAIKHGSPFTWSQGKSFQELEQTEREEAIKKLMPNELSISTKEKAL